MTTLQLFCADIRRQVARFRTDQSGATAVEYALIAIGISVVIVVAVTAIGASVKSAFTSVSAGFP